MHRFALVVVVLMLTAGGVAQDKQPDKALCSVCALRGETDPEKVKAATEYEGEPYYFCSENCKKQFDADPVAYLPPELPRPAPDFTVAALDGRPLSLQDFAGKVVLLDFWATWCKPCLETMPGLQQLYDAHHDQGLVILGVSIDEDEDRRKKVRKFIEKLGVSYPIALDTQNIPAWHTFKVKAIPAMFLIDRAGRIVQQWSGVIEHDEVETAVARIMASHKNE